MAPCFRGLGYGMLFTSKMTDIYYSMILAWCVFYLCNGFTSNLPWGTCEEEYNTYDCYRDTFQNDCDVNEPGTVYYNGTCTQPEDYCTAHDYEDGFDEATGNCVGRNTLPSDTPADLPLSEVIKGAAISPAEDYFDGFVLGVTKNATGARYNMEDYGSIRWQLVLSLLGAWTLITMVLVRGIASYGKAAYFITLSPYVILTALIIYAAQLDGAIDGIEFYVNPDWDKLTELTVWAQAASQILFSLSVGFGSQIILASYNKFSNNTFRDAVLISVCNSLTSIYAGFVVFSILGFLAVETNRDVEDVVTEGIKMAFVAYPSAVLEMDVPPLWSFLFFFMLLNLALSSTCGSVENFIAFIIDEWPSLREHRVKVLLVFNFLSFLGGLPFCFEGGIYLFTIFDTRLVASLLIGVTLEMVLVGWVYGIRNFLDNLNEMGMDFRFSSHGWRKCTGYFLALMICIVTPGALIFLTIQAWVEFEGMEFEGRPRNSW